MSISGVKHLRKAMRLSQTTVAALVGTDPRTLRRWENGEAEAPLMYRMLMTSVTEHEDPAGYLHALSGHDLPRRIEAVERGLY